MPLKLEARLFKELGFIRKQCKSCGSYFWTLDPDREFCGDQPCVDYTFLEKPPTPLRDIALGDVREKFLSFMEKEGHVRIKRYPIVARWRDDVYLVGASIYDFQPWVTEGIVPPPANPLTISQPCIRLTDIDSVGRSGRHLTEFEMMAHHAFNYPGTDIYWIDRTVELCFNFFTRELKIPPEKITFKEDWWSGGGNAGEDFEVLIEGLEVATLVFMHYRVIDDKLVEMKNRIVDTGYGLERILWLCRGSPTVYDAVFPSIIEKLRERAGISKPPREILLSVARMAGKFDVKKLGIERFRLLIASKLGMDVKELEQVLIPMESLYILADHTRALVFMLGDGVVPSNVGAGYLARLLIRRAIRALDRLSLDVPLTEVVDMQLKLISRDFPEYLELRDSILDMVDVEERRYRETLRRGRELVRRRVERLKAKGISSLPTDTLIEFYDSHGLDPYFVREICSELKMNVKIPDDFYGMLAERHQMAKVKEKEVKVELKEEELEGIPPTRPLYYEDPYASSFSAKVLKVLKNKYVILDKTLFYPEGGGQPADKGYLVTEDGVKVEVEDVQKIGNVIVHIVKSAKNLREGILVKGIIDVNRRRALMRSHTATHIVIGAARRVLGPHVWQAGAQKGVERSHLDITHYKKITPQELKLIELYANKVVAENRPVKVTIMDRNKAEAQYGFILYQGGVVPGREIRVVEIEGWDAEACGGTHCSRTGEIGMIKIIKADRIQDGVERLEFCVGEYALRYVQSREELLRRLSEILKTPVDDIVSAVEKLQAREKALRRELEGLKKELFKVKVDHALSTAKIIRGAKLICEHTTLIRDDAIKLAELIVRKDPNSIVVFIGLEDQAAFVIVRAGDDVVKRGFSAVGLARKLARMLGGSAGGSDRFAQGGGRNIAAIDKAVEEAESTVGEMLS